MHMFPRVIQSTLTLPLQDVKLTGDLWKPEPAFALVIFTHGSGSSRLSPRNRMVAKFLNGQGMATLLFDLLTEKEDHDYSNRFNLNLLADRLEQATTWLCDQPAVRDFPVGFFGASTGAAAALMAAERIPWISAMVSRGGRPDLAMNVLSSIKASTLFIVGSLDKEVLKLNQQALNHMHCDKDMRIIAGATHLFEERGAMEQVCVVAANWFEMHLQPLELTR